MWCFFGVKLSLTIQGWALKNARGSALTASTVVPALGLLQVRNENYIPRLSAGSEVERWNLRDKCRSALELDAKRWITMFHALNDWIWLLWLYWCILDKIWWMRVCFMWIMEEFRGEILSVDEVVYATT